MAEKKKILYIVEAMGGGVFTYIVDALQYAVDSNWLKTNPVKTVDPCLDNSPVLFNDFLMDWLKMMKSRVAITTYANYEIVLTRRR